MRFDVAREVFVCAVSTGVPEANPPGSEAMRFLAGDVGDLGRLADHDEAERASMRARLERGDRWLVGEVGGAIVTYTFLSTARDFDYPALPGCRFALRADVAYGYGAWTPPALRGHGYRRRAFLEELRWLRQLDKKWEASVFVASQLEPARRSLGPVGIVVEPLWRVTYGRDRRAAAERLGADEDDRCVPITSYNE
ncbi:MAG TPA: hypothetical protein VF997_11140 [Polyangia bacterium]